MNADEVMSLVLPQFFPAHWLDPPGLVWSDFPSRIRIGYVLRRDGSYSYLCEEDFSSLSVPLEELHAVALSNLAQLPSASIQIGKVPGGFEGWIFATDDNFAAARILLPSVQEIFREELGEEFLVSIPHRDDCFCWSLTQTAERQDKHMRDALADFLEDDYNLTPDILLCGNGGFRLYREQGIPVAGDGGGEGE